MDRRLAPKWDPHLKERKPYPFNIYPHLSDSYILENLPHLNRMRDFLDDLIMPFKDKAVKLCGEPFDVQYEFRHNSVHPPDVYTYFIRLMLVRGGRGYNIERTMEYYDAVKDRPDPLSDWEMYMQEEFKRDFHDMFWKFLEDYKRDKKLQPFQR